MTPITAGAMLSLKCNCTIFGGSVSTLPSAGSEERSVAWAHAALAMQSADSSAARPASTRAIGIALRLRCQLEAGCRRLAVMPMAAFRGNIDPAADPLLAFLHHWKIQRGIRLQSRREIAGATDFIEIGTGDL